MMLTQDWAKNEPIVGHFKGFLIESVVYSIIQNGKKNKLEIYISALRIPQPHQLVANSILILKKHDFN